MLNKTKEQNLKDLIGACPFCHKTKTKIIEKTDGGVPHYNGTTWTQRYKAYVTCNTCHARGPIVSKALPHPNSASNHNVNWDEVHNQKKDVQAQAVAEWNNATNPQNSIDSSERGYHT